MRQLILLFRQLPFLVLFIIFFTFTFFSDVAFSIYCTESACAEITASYNSPCQPIGNCTKVGYRTFLDPDQCNCCPYCFDYLEDDAVCEKYTPSKPTEMCGPHLTCTLPPGAGPTVRATCKKITSSPFDRPGSEDSNFCMARRARYEDPTRKRGIAEVYPECDSHGFYAPRQCLPGSICYCSDENGNRVFGLATPQQYQDCACARDVAKLQQFGFQGRFPHCLPNGDYDELQCVVRTCFCRSHPEEKFAMDVMNNSKCFDPNIHIFEPSTPRYYMRDCELSRARIEVQIADAALEGRTRVVADMPTCGPDGNYAPVQSRFNQFYCANATTGQQIENYEAIKYSAAADIMNCDCARVRALLQNSATGKPRCCSNGNYRPLQCVGTKCYCVDRMGRQDPYQKEHGEDATDLDCFLDGNNPTPDPISGELSDCPYEHMKSSPYYRPNAVFKLIT